MRAAEIKEREKVVKDLKQRKAAYNEKLSAEREAEDFLQSRKAKLETELQNAEDAKSKRDTETPKAKEQLSEAESILERVKELLSWATVDKKEDLDRLIKTQTLREIWLDEEINDIRVELLRRKEEAFQDTLSKLGDAGYLFCVLKFLETALESTTMAILTITCSSSRPLAPMPGVAWPRATSSARRSRSSSPLSSSPSSRWRTASTGWSQGRRVSSRSPRRPCSLCCASQCSSHGPSSPSESGRAAPACGARCGSCASRASKTTTTGIPT